VRPGETLALVGGNIEIEGGNLTAMGDVNSSELLAGGRIELGSVGGNNTVNLTEGWMLGYEEVQDFQYIDLTKAGSVDVSGNPTGTIRVWGRSISVRDGSALLALTLGSESAQTDNGIFINASEELEVTGKTQVREPSGRMSPLESRLQAEVWLGAAGNGGDVSITTNRLRVGDMGAFISSGTRGMGKGGNLGVTATDINLMGGNLFARSDVEGSGQGGNITVNTDRLSLGNSSTIDATTSGRGKAGDVTILARESITLDSRNPKVGRDLPAIRSTNSPDSDSTIEPTGDGGDINITTDRLIVRGGASISTSTQGKGNRGDTEIGDAGDITIDAREIEVSGVAEVTNNQNTISIRPSQIAARVNPNAVGKGGDINIETDRLQVSGGGTIAVSTQGSGNAGELNIHADTIELIGTGKNQPSSFEALVEVTTSSRNPTGDGGGITVDVDRLLVANGARIAATTQGSGKAGNIEINAQDVTITGFASHPSLGIQPSSVAAQVEATRNNGNPIGNGGEVRVRADRLLLENGGRISASTQGFGDAGRVNITAHEIELRGFASLDPFPDEPSRIEALAESTIYNLIPTGDAGSVSIQANFLRMTDGAEILVRSEGEGTTGNLDIDSSHLQLRNGSEINAQADFDSSSLLIYGPPAPSSIGLIRYDQPPVPNRGGNITIETDTLTALENSDITANASGTGGNIIINAQGIFGTEVRESNTLESDITATGEIKNGTIEIQTPDVDPSTGLLQLPETPIDAASLIGQNPCAKGVESEFVDRGRGGLPPIPSEALRGEESSADLLDFPPDWESRVLEDDRNSEPVTEPPVRQLVEAQGWFIDSQGRVILTANPPAVTPNSGWEHPNCPLDTMRETI
jgi:large exoprotein involved in heme utilization and adhesion